MFAGFDIALREIGVGDLTVPKKMKKMAQGWLGRGVAYRAALDAGDQAGLALAIARNVYGDAEKAGQGPVQRLARYAFAQDKTFEGWIWMACSRARCGLLIPPAWPRERPASKEDVMSKEPARAKGSQSAGLQPFSRPFSVDELLRRRTRP